MFVTNWISTTKIQKISEITNFFRHYFLSRTEVLIHIVFRDAVNLEKSSTHDIGTQQGFICLRNVLTSLKLNSLRISSAEVI